MANCLDNLELISAYIDNELPEADKLQLESHFRECEECFSIYEAYRGISNAANESLSPAPESLSNGVMAKIRSGETQIIDVAASKRSRLRLVLTRYVPIAAACLVFMLLAVPYFYSGNQDAPGSTGGAPRDEMSVAMPEHAASGSTMGSSGSESGAAADGSDNGFAMNAESGSLAEEESGEIFSVTGKPTGTATGAQPGDAGSGGDAGWDADAGSGIDSGERSSGGDSDQILPEELPEESADDVSEPADIPDSLTGLAPDHSDDAYFDAIYAIIMISGRLPETLELTVPINSSAGGEAYYEISRIEAITLLDEIAGTEGVLVKLVGDNGTYAQVFYSPGE